MDRKDKSILELLYENVYIKEHNVKKEDEHKKEVRDENDELEPSTPAQIDDDEDLKSKKTDNLDEEPSEDEECYDYEEAHESLINDIKNIIEEAKKKKKSKGKVNPWAVEKSIEKKTGKKFGKKKKEEIVKGIKKFAKKSGKKITSKPVKKKVVKENAHDIYNTLTNTVGLQLPPESSLKYAMATLAAAYTPLAATGIAVGIKNLIDKFKKYLEKNKDIANAPISDKLKSEVDILKKNLRNNIAAEKVVLDAEPILDKAVGDSLEKEIKNVTDPKVLKARDELAKLRNPVK